MTAEVRIVREDREGWSVYDGPERCARCGTVTEALHHASDLLHAPRPGPSGAIWRMMLAIETRRPDA